MELKTGTDVYIDLNYTSLRTGQSEHEHENTGENGVNCSESVAVVYEKSEPSELSAYRVNSVQAAISESALNSKMKTYLKDLGFYNGEMGGGYTEELKKALKCFQNAYFGAEWYSVSDKVVSGLQREIENAGTIYYKNYTNSKLTDALKKLGITNPTDYKQNFARIQTFLERAMGCNKYQVAGIMGNIMQESWFSPKTVNSKSGAFGLIQWNGVRKTYLNEYASKNGYSADNMGIQLAFFRYEMTKIWGKGDIDEKAPNSELVKSWNMLKNEYKYSFYAVSEFFQDNIEGYKEEREQRKNYSSIIYQAIS